MTLSMNDTQHNTLCIECHYAECHYPECRVSFPVTLNVAIMSVVILNVVTPYIFMCPIAFIAHLGLS
jgi:hypothetical protein